jgi:hypothetical protein
MVPRTYERKGLVKLLGSRRNYAPRPALVHLRNSPRGGALVAEGVDVQRPPFIGGNVSAGPDTFSFDSAKTNPQVLNRRSRLTSPGNQERPGYADRQTNAMHWPALFRNARKKCRLRV